MAQTKAPPEKKTDWVTPIAVVLGVGGLGVGLYLYLRKKPVKRTFNISKPIPSPHDATLGQIVTITCGISMTEGSALNGIAVLQVFEGSILSGHGSPLGQVSKPLQISTGESKTVTFSYTAIGAIGRKDVAIVIYDGDTEVGSNEWDDLFYTIESGVSFALARPSVLPNPASPGSTVTITCPITSNSSEVKSVTANIKIYEGSILAAHGTLLSTKTVSFSISPGQTYNVVVTDIAVTGSIDRRDIGVEVYVGGQLITSDEWDDVFYVQSDGTTYPVISFGDIICESWIPVGGSISITSEIISDKAASIQSRMDIINNGMIINTQTKSVALSAGLTNTVFDFSAVNGSAGLCTVRVTVIYLGIERGSMDYPNAFGLIQQPTTINFSIGLAVDSSPIPNPTGWMPFYKDSDDNLVFPVEGYTAHLPLSTVFHFNNVPSHGFLTVDLVNASTGWQFQWSEAFFMDSGSFVTIHIKDDGSTYITF